jgi:hypothetical protein
MTGIEQRCLTRTGLQPTSVPRISRPYAASLFSVMRVGLLLVLWQSRALLIAA